MGLARRCSPNAATAAWLNSGSSGALEAARACAYCACAIAFLAVASGRLR